VREEPRLMKAWARLYRHCVRLVVGLLTCFSAWGSRPIKRFVLDDFNITNQPCNYIHHR
jgi:hypothetical protein